MHTYYLLGCQGTSDIVHKIGSELNLPAGTTETSKFPNEELRLKIPDYGDTTYLVGSLSRPVNTGIIEYLLAADALKRAGSRRIVGLLTWYPYSRQDKVFVPGEPLSAKVIASVLQTVSITELYTLDLHNPSIAGYFEIPVINCSATPLFINRIRQLNLSDTIVVSPDLGAIKNSSRIAQELNLPIAHANKSRDLTSGQVRIMDLSTKVDGKNILIFDDMIATGSTLIEIADFLKQRGARRITVCATHHLYLAGVQELLEKAPIDQLFVTNSIPKPDREIANKLEILDASPVFATALSERILPTG
jgi:ribose-phosphate pyrophosphokinase